jgi:hypothetical protein
VPPDPSSCAAPQLFDPAIFIICTPEAGGEWEMRFIAVSCFEMLWTPRPISISSISDTKLFVKSFPQILVSFIIFTCYNIQNDRKNH